MEVPKESDLVAEGSRDQFVLSKQSASTLTHLVSSRELDEIDHRMQRGIGRGEIRTRLTFLPIAQFEPCAGRRVDRSCER
jgi:hypothetical protein